MKRLVCIVLILIFCISLCACNTTKEAKSETDARRILMSAYSGLSEISLQLDDKDKVLEYSNMAAIKRRIDNYKSDIKSTDFYKSLDSVSEKYEQANELHSKVLKKYNKKYTELKKKQDKLDKESSGTNAKKKSTTNNKNGTRKSTNSSSLR